MGVVPTIIVPPRSRSVVIDRHKLNELLDRVADSRLTTIRAPAGSGKTGAALLWFSQLKAAGRPGLWLSARAGIRDLNAFTLALKAAAVAAGLPCEALDPKQGDAGWFASLAAGSDRRPVLVVDDAQLLSAETQQFLGKLIDSARDAITTLVVSRGVIGFPIARMRAMGIIVEIGANDLRFSCAEARELVSRIAEAPIGADLIQEIHSETEGWASGLVMAGNFIRSKGRFAGNWEWLRQSLRAEFASYFDEEVFALQPQSICDFLLETSILDELDPSICAAITSDQTARATLEDVFRSGLFLNAIDRTRNRYAYHRLFRQYALGRLEDREPSRVPELQRRASRHYAQTGEHMTALSHARHSGDQEFLGDQLDHLANELTYSGYLYRIDEFGSELPWSVISSRPMLLLALAWRRIRRLSFPAAERMINAAAAIAQTRPDDITLGYLVRHRRIMLEAGRDNMALIEADAEKLLLELGDDEPYLSCTLLAQLMAARREFYHFHDTLRLEAETRRALERPGSEFASIALKSTVAPTLVLLGKTRLARHFLEEALALAEAQQGAGSGLAALPALPLAEILYDVGELDRAAQLVDQYLPAVRQWGFVDQLASGYLVRARLAFAQGDAATALAGLEEAHLIAIECGLDRLRTAVVAEQVRILVKTGEIAGAESTLRAGDMEVREEPVPTLTPTRKNESVAIAWLRIEIQRNRLARALKVATRWLEVARRSSATRSTVTFLLLLAEIAVLQGNRSKARRAVREAIELAEPSGWTHILLDEGDVICSLLSEAYGDGVIPETPVDVFASRILAHMLNAAAPELEKGEGRSDECYLASNLATREIDILTMVSGGLRNREIGARLGLTEGTVKWYMQQIYDKLGVRRRSQAVLRARRLGLLG